MKKIIITGGRDYNGRGKLFGILDFIKPDMVIHGGAKGADALASLWADTSFTQQRVFNANWDAYGKAAGPIRNRQMLEAHQDAIVIAFPGGRGTADCVKAALQRGMTVIKIIE